MYHPWYDFGKAYQSELLRSAVRWQLPQRNSHYLPKLWGRFLSLLGEALIALGERIKCEGGCAEFSQGRV